MDSAKLSGRRDGAAWHAPATPETVACPDCDLLQRIPPLDRGDRARCARCRLVLATAPRSPLDLPLALTLTAAVIAFCAVIAAAIYILFMLAVLLAVRRPPAPHWVGELLRWSHSMQAW